MSNRPPIIIFEQVIKKFPAVVLRNQHDRIVMAGAGDFNITIFNMLMVMSFHCFKGTGNLVIVNLQQFLIE